MPRPTRITIGALGEDAAVHHLQQRGYTVLDRNFRTRRGELDIVADDGSAIVFCEVKARVGSGGSGPSRPFDAIGPGKRRQVLRMASEWLRAHPPGSGRPAREDLRFDALGIVLTPAGEVVALEHLEQAF